MDRRRSTGHVVMVGSHIRCLHCGAADNRFPGGEPQEVGALLKANKAFTKTHAKCPAPIVPRCSLCGQQGHDFAECNKVRGLTKETWIAGDDVGLSSKTIWIFMMGHSMSLMGSWGPCYPLDPDDFGRCYRLIHLVPEWRARMVEMASVPGWERIAPAWEELTALFEEEVKSPSGMAPKLYARLQELEGRR